MSFQAGLALTVLWLAAARCLHRATGRTVQVVKRPSLLIPTLNSCQIFIRQKATIAQMRRRMAGQDLTEKRNITPEMAVKILRKDGVEIDEKKAVEVLDFLYFLAKLTVDRYINDPNGESK